MYINPNKLIDDNVVRNVNSTSQIQPNAIDFSLDELYEIDNLSPAYISNHKPHNIMRSHKLMEPIDLREKAHVYAHLNEKNANSHNTSRPVGWELAPGKFYDGQSQIYVEVPEGMVAYLVVRSTFNRNAVFLISGLYDSGFKGNIGFTIYNPAGYTYIEKGTMFGQIVFAQSDSAGTYSGGYNTEEGKHWTATTNTVEVEKVEVKQEVTITEEVIVEPVEQETESVVSAELVEEVSDIVPEDTTVDEVKETVQEEVVVEATTSSKKSKK